MEEFYKGVKTLKAKTQEEWRQWLHENHSNEQSIWLIIYRKESNIASVLYPQAVDEALCFGWIDSKPNKRDAESYYQFFSKRNPKSNWSKVNKEKIARLKKHGKITKAGLEMVQIAKSNGTWNALDAVEKLELPIDLKANFNLNLTAFNNWNKFPKSVRRGILEWIYNAKRPETRAKRISETVSSASQNIRANQYNKQ